MEKSTFLKNMENKFNVNTFYRFKVEFSQLNITII